MKNKNAIIYGIVSGVVILIYHLGFYFVNKELIIHPAFFFGVYAIHLPFMILAALKDRSINEGLLDFKSSLRTVFLSFIIGMVFYYLIYYILFNVDTELISMMKQAAHEGLEWQKEQGFLDEDEFDSHVEAWGKSDFSVTIWSVITGIPFRIIGGFLLSLLVAAITKR